MSAPFASSPGLGAKIMMPMGRKALRLRFGHMVCTTAEPKFDFCT